MPMHLSLFNTFPSNILVCQPNIFDKTSLRQWAYVFAFHYLIRGTTGVAEYDDCGGGGDVVMMMTMMTMMTMVMMMMMMMMTTMMMRMTMMTMMMMTMMTMMTMMMIIAMTATTTRKRRL